MAKKNVLVKSGVRKNLPDIAAFLRDMADKIESGKLTLVQGGEDIIVELPDSLKFELEYYEQAKKHGLKKQLEIELEWIEGGKKNQSVTLG